MAMSKAMAMECSGEVFVMTDAKLKDDDAETGTIVQVPENGIWWQVEFPTLYDGNRPANKRVTKVS